MKNNPVYKLLRTLILGACLFLGTQVSHAISYHFSIDTSGLSGDPGAPFALDFQFIGDGSNTITIGNFKFGGGSASNDPSMAGAFGATSGDLSSSVTLTTGSGGEFFNEFFQGFTAGSRLSFDVFFYDPVVNLTPDMFSFSILDNQLFNIPTSYGVGNALGVIEFNGANPAPAVFVADNGVTVTVPDHGTTFGLLGMALLGLVGVHQSSRLRALLAA